MLFSTQPFLLVFLPVVLLLFYSCANVRPLRQLVLIGASFVFYGIWNWRFVPFLFLLTLLNWLLAYQFGRTKQKAWLVIGIIINLGMLGFFKYANFFAENIEALWGRQHVAWQIVLPLGISFFVFQKISYLIDLSRGAKNIYNVLDFFEFVTFFPQLISGPLVRHNEIIPQFENNPKDAYFWENISKGLCFIVIGLIKKAGIAESLGMICNPLFDQVSNGHMLNWGQAWVAAISYSLQIFFDFSGYSDMAIGVALLFGLRLPFNFNAPYQSRNLQEFWRRWHMTLSRFFRDYLYIPLGGNRCSSTKEATNLMLTMLLAGLWHGAGWNFIVWGGLHGSGLVVNHFWKRTNLTFPPFLGWFLTLLFLIFTWVIFRASDFNSAVHIWQSMIGLYGTGNVTFKHSFEFWIGILLVLLCPASQILINRYLRPSVWIAVIGGVVAVLFLLLIGGRIPDAFIYFRF